MQAMRKTLLTTVLLAAIVSCGSPTEPDKPAIKPPCVPVTPPALADFVGTYSLTTVDGGAIPYDYSLGSVNGAIRYLSGTLLIRADSTVQFSVTTQMVFLGTVTNPPPQTVIEPGKWVANSCGAIEFNDPAYFSSAITVNGSVLSWNGPETFRGGSYASGNPYYPRLSVTRSP